MAGILLGCAAQTPNPWQTVEIPSEAVEAPLPCYELPLPDAWDEVGKGRYEALSACAQANHDIAAEHAAQIQELRRASTALVEAGKHQRAIAEMRAEMLEDERRHHFWSSVGYWVAIVGLAAAL